ncbi:MAG: hypothetical protein HN707_03530, partial [Verrucomicrobia bacterium]|nr:hypothetical protein [Verrucomicrobiota bacterium]
NVGLNVVIVNAALLGQVDGVGVGVEAGGLHAWAELAEVRAGAAADVESGLNFSCGNELRCEIGSGTRAQKLSERVRHALGQGD